MICTPSHFFFFLTFKDSPISHSLLLRRPPVTFQLRAQRKLLRHQLSWLIWSPWCFPFSLLCPLSSVAIPTLLVVWISLVICLSYCLCFFPRDQLLFLFLFPCYIVEVWTRMLPILNQASDGGTAWEGQPCWGAVSLGAGLEVSKAHAIPSVSPSASFYE